MVAKCKTEVIASQTISRIYVRNNAHSLIAYCLLPLRHSTKVNRLWRTIVDNQGHVKQICLPNRIWLAVNSKVNFRVQDIQAIHCCFDARSAVHLSQIPTTGMS